MVRMVLQRLRENNLKVNVKKVQFGLSEAKLLGVTINGRTKRWNFHAQNVLQNYKDFEWVVPGLYTGFHI
jgi:hypothetical protein